MFTIPEMELQKVVEPLRAGEQLVVEAWDRGEGAVLATGSLKTVDNQIDLASGTALNRIRELIDQAKPLRSNFARWPSRARWQSGNSSPWRRSCTTSTPTRRSS